MMFKMRTAALVIGLSAAGFSSVAKAEVVTYTLTFAAGPAFQGASTQSGGTGTLTLNIPSPPGLLSGPSSIFPGSTAGPGNLAASDFQSLSVTIDGFSFLFSAIGNGNNQVADLGFSNGLLTNISLGGSGGTSTNTTPTTTEILGLGAPAPGNSVNVAGVNGCCVGFSTSYTVSAPLIAAVPEPSTWAMMILGFCGLGFMAYRRKQSGPKLRLA
jgi:hypothetical protein